MAADGNIYESDRLAYGYAHNRPPVHQAIIQRVKKDLGLERKLPRALDIGCGAGLSTAALQPLADQLYGIEPILPMLKYRKAVTNSANFTVATAEHLPFADDTFDLMSAAGALNYADLSQFLPEAKRVLNSAGVLVIYDFSEGRKLLNDPSLERWYESFIARFPAPPGYAMDVTALPYENYGLSLAAYQPFEVAIPMNHQSYVAYAMSETRIELALQQGHPESDIQHWCEQTLQPVFSDQTREVYFDAYTAYVSQAKCVEL